MSQMGTALDLSQPKKSATFPVGPAGALLAITLIAVVGLALAFAAAGLIAPKAQTATPATFDRGYDVIEHQRGLAAAAALVVIPSDESYNSLTGIHNLKPVVHFPVDESYNSLTGIHNAKRVVRMPMDESYNSLVGLRGVAR